MKTVGSIYSSRIAAGALTIVLPFLASCGGYGQAIENEATGSVKALVAGSKSFDPNTRHGKIEKYRVVITGDGIAEPIEAIFDGAAGEGVVDGVPSGENRAVAVEAVNANNAIIRAGEASGVAISSGGLTLVRVDMESVPIFANLSDGNSVPNTFFFARIFSEPGSKVVVEDENMGSTAALFNLADGALELLPDASTFLAVLKPALLAPGPHRLTVRNSDTGRSSTVLIDITDGTILKAAPLFGGGLARPWMTLPPLSVPPPEGEGERLPNRRI